ncbi:MAG TPA: hypothetical protein VD973_15280 [Symbiobacteriaceae bacterium]|nr:hypothetical protein [Symbiobacteriaceae bacterium]
MTMLLQMTARELFDDGDLWRDRIARLAFPVVLWCAKFGHTITYGQLAEELRRRHDEEPKFRKTVYGMPAGKIGDILELLSEEWGIEIPPINALIVNAETRLPGSGADGYLERYLSAAARRKPASEMGRNALAEQVIADVHHFTEWDRVARHLGIKRLPEVSVVTEKELEPINLSEPDPFLLREGGRGGEGDQHKRLKEWAAAHPEIFAEFGRFKKGKMEVMLQSGDELDVCFTGTDMILAVEVKAANAPECEVRRGVFQCVKYRAVLRATQFAKGEHPTAQAVLLVERRLPDEMVRLAKRLKVQWMVADPGKR